MALRLSEEFDDDGLDLLSSSKDKGIRRRSSKACDNCRKAKCKCEPSQNTGEPCRNCHLLGLGCTFLGPSRKRGPPKGYIDAIESRLHQLEAILGALIVSSDPRARSLIADLAAGDDLAHSVITRIEGGPFGPKAKADAQDPSAASSSSNGVGKKGTSGSARRNTAPGAKMSISSPEDPIDLDPYEWQDRLERAITQRNGTSRMSASIMDGIILPPVPPRDQPDQLGPRRLYGVDSNSFPDLPSTANSLANRSLRQLPASSTWTATTSSGNQRRRLDSDALENDDQRRVRRPTSGIGLNDSHDSWSPLSSVSSPASIHHRAPSIASQNAQQSTASTSTVPDAVDEEDQFTDVDTSRFAENEAASSDLDAMGQLSIDDQKDIRYHGRTSGLHLLASASSMSSFASRSRTSSGFANPSLSSTLNQGTDGVSSEENAKHRNGFWQFPRAGVWPPLDVLTAERPPSEISPWLLNVGEHLGSTQIPRTISSPGSGVGQAPPQGFGFTPQAGEPFAACIEEKGLAGLGDMLPSRDVQENLLSLYFTHVHPVFPIVHKAHFLKVYRDVVEWIRDANGDSQKPPPKPLSLALLFAMLAVASRFTNEGKPSVPAGNMWAAGLGYADRVREIVYHGKIPSRLSSVQAILLLSYVDVGVGSMAMAWHSIGLACRTALDAGLNRSVDKWHAGASAMVVYTPEEKESCRRIWYAVMLMDNYISTYIGRPLSVMDSDYDTPLPDDDAEDMEILYLISRTPTARAPGACVSNSLRYLPAPSRIISCFRSRAVLSRILAAVMHKVYSIRPTWSRITEAANLEARLDKWYYDLPEYLRYDCHSKSPIPAPHILTLHLDYWCTVLLLHRPFIRVKAASKGVKVESDDGLSNATRTSQKAYGICQNAANRLVSIATAYSEVFSLDHLPAFVTFYVFTASIMHVTVLLDNPGDLQSARALQQAMTILEKMSVVWPSAGRAWDILDGSKASIRHAENFHKEDHPDRRKRVAEDDLERRGPSHQHHQHPHQSQTQQHHQLGHQASQTFQSTSQGPQRSPMTSNPVPYNSFRSPLQLSSHPAAEDSSYTVPSDFTAPESSSLQLNNQNPLPHVSSRFNSYSVLASPQSTFPPPQRSQWPLQSPSQDHQSSYSGSGDSYLDQSRSSSSPFNFPELQQQQSKNQFQPSQLHNSADSVQTAGRGSNEHSFWNEFVSSGDPFADPSTLSTSLYHVPLLPDSQPRNQMPPPMHSHAPSIFQVFDRQGVPLPPQRYQFGNMDPARQGSS